MINKSLQVKVDYFKVKIIMQFGFTSNSTVLLVSGDNVKYIKKFWNIFLPYVYITFSQYKLSLHENIWIDHSLKKSYILG